MATQDEINKGADGRCETMVIQGEKGPVIINKSDFDERIHKAYEEPKVESKQLHKGYEESKSAHKK